MGKGILMLISMLLLILIPICILLLLLVRLLKGLHKLILVAKGLARKRTEQMTRDELFKLSQERQKLLK